MPTIETQRLYLRTLTLDDLDDLFLILSDPEVIRYVGSGQPASREETRTALLSIINHWKLHGFGRWAVVDKESQRLIGFGGLRSLFGTPEVVYHLAKWCWGKGLATEMAGAVLRYGFEEHPFDRIVAIAKPLNVASVRVMEKVGMKYVKHTSYYEIDVVEYELVRSRFRSGGSFYRVDRA